MKTHKLNIILIFFAIFMLFYACKTIDSIKVEQTQGIDSLKEDIPENVFVVDTFIPEEKTLRLSFSGDLMAHINVTRMKDFSLIWKNVKPLFETEGLHFINLETPVHDKRPYENYPFFNVKKAYVEAALDAGFNVFSLANNHTNDQGKEGILETEKYFAELEKRGIFWAGIKKEADENFSYALIEKNGFKILFFAYTEILNHWTAREHIDFVQATKKDRDAFVNFAKKIKAETMADFCVISVHCAEPEYVLEVPASRKTFYHSLTEELADIVWANHPHLVQEWEWIGRLDTGRIEKAIFYACGNTISGQRLSLNYEYPAAMREYTGDGIVFSLDLKKDAEEKTYIESYSHQLITTHIDEDRNSLVQFLDLDFIKSQNEKNKKYYEKRLELMNKIQGTITWK